MRVFELANRFGMPTSEVIAILNAPGDTAFPHANGPLAEVTDGLDEIQDEVAEQFALKLENMRAAQAKRFTYEIGNFKGFGRPQKAHIRPITLLFGPNSGGKSSFLHSLLFLHHFQENGNPDVRFAKRTGQSIDLGGFDCLTHGRKSGEGTVSARFEFQSATTDYIHRKELHPCERISVEYLFSRPEPSSKPNVRSIKVAMDGEPLFALSRRQGEEFRFDYLSLDHAFFQAIFQHFEQGPLELPWPSALQQLRKECLQVMAETALIEAHCHWFRDDPTLLDLRTSISPLSAENAYGRIKEKVPGNAERSILWSQTKENLKPVHDTLLGHITKLLAALSNAIWRKMFHRLSYLAPLRVVPGRYYNFDPQRPDNWHAIGGEAWDLLLKDEKLRSRVNAFLSNEKFFDSPYLIIPKYHGNVERIKNEVIVQVDALNERLRAEKENDPDQFADKIDSSSAIDANAWGNHVFEPLIDNPEYEIFGGLALLDVKKKTFVSHLDVGTGICQLLPVITYAMHFPKTNLCIEQPEVHIHPKIQAELGDVFIDAALGQNQTNLVIETHSEHLILRILRRIRETTNGSLKPGLTPVHYQDVSILYISPGPEGASQIMEIPLNEQGEFLKPWPGGFFEEDTKELFGEE